jgi:hypothetical protein
MKTENPKSITELNGFYCECGKFVPYGTTVIEQINHINGKAHKRGIGERKGAQPSLVHMKAEKPQELCECCGKNPKADGGWRKVRYCEDCISRIARQNSLKRRYL